MAYDETTAERVRARLQGRRGITERKMFGGLAFMAHGHMFIGVSGSRLMVRVGSEHYADALARPHAGVMDFTGKPMRGYVYVEPAGFALAQELAFWVEKGYDFVTSLPPK